MWICSWRPRVCWQNQEQLSIPHASGRVVHNESQPHLTDIPWMRTWTHHMVPHHVSQLSCGCIHQLKSAEEYSHVLELCGQHYEAAPAVTAGGQRLPPGRYFLNTYWQCQLFRNCGFVSCVSKVLSFSDLTDSFSKNFKKKNTNKN